MTAVAVRDASTVALLRDGASALEVWLMTRVTGMAFAGGMAVFPGGRVDDADRELPFAAGTDDAAAARLGCDPASARAVVGAAVREVFEETGVLLSAPPASHASSREDVESGRMSFGDLLRAHELAVDGAAVRPWSRWVTPEGEVRRYDTRFFVAGLPVDALAAEGTTEASSAGWFGIGSALEAAQRGDLGMLPPTMMTLASLAGYQSVAAVLDAAAHRSLEPVRPTVERTDDGGYLTNLPDGTSFPLPASLFPPS